MGSAELDGTVQSPINIGAVYRFEPRLLTRRVGIEATRTIYPVFRFHEQPTDMQ